LRKLTRIYFSFAQIRVIRGFKVDGAGGGTGLLRWGEATEEPPSQSFGAPRVRLAGTLAPPKKAVLVLVY
jgi:hypothetical protein